MAPVNNNTNKEEPIPNKKYFIFISVLQANYATLKRHREEGLLTFSLRVVIALGTLAFNLDYFVNVNNLLSENF